MFHNPFYLVILFGSMVLSWLASSQLQRAFQKYSQVPMSLSGREIAMRMLADAGIRDVEVTGVPGQLTDHYNPATKRVNLSEVVYGTRNLAAAAVAAHECGHAVQHAKGYSALKMRSALVPVVQVSSHLAQYVIAAGFALLAIAHNFPWVLLAGIVLFAVSTVFSLITLPVEFDASRRALLWLEHSGVAQGEQHQMAKDALKWAAMTYVVAAIASLGHLFYYLMIFLRSRNTN
jgi:Zn-dependent membrane protease YugP